MTALPHTLGVFARTYVDMRTYIVGQTRSHVQDVLAQMDSHDRKKLKKISEVSAKEPVAHTEQPVALAAPGPVVVRCKA